MLEQILHFKGTWRSYQQRVLDKYDRYSQDRKIHIVAAPGSGKTTLGIELIKRIDYSALILVPSITIREQWVKKAFNNIFTVALTATPPYDSNLSMWTRYMDMCGDIDEEITVPELVKDGTLCPHQDYVYFNYPASQEKQKLSIFEENSQSILEQLI